MAEKTGSLADAISASFEGSGVNPDALLTEEGTVGTETQEDQQVRDGLREPTEAGEGAEGTATGTEAAQTEVGTEGATGTGTEATAAAAAEGTEDVPERYFEVDLSGLPAEERKAVVAALAARDDEIGKLLRGRPKDETPAPEGAAPEPPAPMSDEDILRGLGVDPDNPFSEETAKVAVPLVRSLQALTEKLDTLSADRELERMEAHWTSRLDQLEKDNGQLPVDRVAVLEFAADNGLTTPEDVYWRIAGPAKRQVESAVAAATARLAATGTPAPTKQEVGSTRPRGSAATEEVPVKEATVRDAVAKEGKKILRDLGIG